MWISPRPDWEPPTPRHPSTSSSDGCLPLLVLCSTPGSCLAVPSSSVSVLPSFLPGNHPTRTKMAGSLSRAHLTCRFTLESQTHFPARKLIPNAVSGKAFAAERRSSDHVPPAPPPLRPSGRSIFPTEAHAPPHADSDLF